MKINSVAFGSAYKIPLDKSNYYALSKELDKCEVFSKDISASSSISRGNNAFYRNIIISDEFDKESRAIAGLISTESTVEEISNIIANAFQRAFGNIENATDYINVATQIRNELHEE